MTKTFIANADYQVIDRTPIKLAKAETVTVKSPDRAWPGWVAIVTSIGKSAHIPADYLTIDGDTATLNEDFDSTDLCVKRGDEVVSVREIHGWHWCEKPSTKETGWIASYLLSARL